MMGTRTPKVIQNCLGVCLSITFLTSSLCLGLEAPSEVSAHKREVEAFYSTLGTLEQAREILLTLAPDAERAELRSLLKGSGKLPKFRIEGDDLIFTANGLVEKVRVLDARKHLVRVRGVEVDLSPSRPMKEKVISLLELLNQKRTTRAWQKLVVPEAHAFYNLLIIPTTAAILSAYQALHEYLQSDDVKKAQEKLAKVQAACVKIKSTPILVASADGSLTNSSNQSGAPEVQRKMRFITDSFCGTGFDQVIRATTKAASEFSSAKNCEKFKAAAKCIDDAANGLGLTPDQKKELDQAIAAIELPSWTKDAQKAAAKGPPPRAMK
jgi:hypothetical protein